MTDHSEEQTPSGAANVEPGGSPSRGPNPSPGGDVEPGGLIPPYDGRTTSSDTPASEERSDSVERMMASTKPANAGSTETPADELSVSEGELTDNTPDSPKGVGTSPHPGGENQIDHHGKEAGRHDEDTQGSTERPAGGSSGRDVTGINPQSPQEEASTAPTGDQGD